jgi:hypothetical protein
MFSRRSFLKGIWARQRSRRLPSRQSTQLRKPGRPLLFALNEGRARVAATFGFLAIGGGIPGGAHTYGCLADGFAAGPVFAIDSLGGSIATVDGR